MVNEERCPRRRAHALGRAAAVGPARALALLACAVVLALAAVHSARAATYKWVDEKGVTHYSDKLPPEAVNRGNTLLDKQAVPIKKVDAAPSADQLKARQAEADRAQAAAREQEAQARRDRALIQSYASEDEIELARNRALGTIDSQIAAARAYSALLAKRREALLTKRSGAGDKGLSVAEERELERTDAETGKQQALIDQKQKERDAAIARYDADKLRWRELRTVARANVPADLSPSSANAAAAGTPAAIGPLPVRR